MQIGCSLHFSFLVAFWFPVFTSSIKIFFPFSAKIINRIDRTTYIRLQKKKSQILKSFFFIFIQLQKFWSLLEIRLQNFITTLKSKTFYAINTVHISSILFIFGVIGMVLEVLPFFITILKFREKNIGLLQMHTPTLFINRISLFKN